MKKQERFKITKAGYKFDLWIFRLYIIAIIVLTASVFIAAGGYKEYLYVNCPSDAMGYCYNPLYKQCSGDYICDVELLYPGETYGEKPPAFLLRYVDLIGFTIIIPFIINHLMHNRKFDFKKHLKMDGE